MAHTTCEILRLKNLLIETWFQAKSLMPLHINNQSAIYIAQNVTFHDHTKHVEVNYHIVRDVVVKKLTCTLFTLLSL